MNVFTYGTLMFPEVWRAVVGLDFATRPATLAGYSIHAVRNEEFPAISPASPTDHVSGLVYHDLDDASIARLDAFEGDFYCRRSVKVCYQDGAASFAEAYVVAEQGRALLLPEEWRADSFLARGGLQQFMEHYIGFRNRS